MKKIVFKLLAIIACVMSLSAIEFKNSLDRGVFVATSGQGASAGSADFMNDGYMGDIVPAGGALDIDPYIDEEGRIVFWIAQDAGQEVQRAEIDKDLSYEIRMQFGNVVFAPFELEELVDVLGELLEEDESSFLNILGKRSEPEGAGGSSDLSKRYAFCKKDKPYPCDFAGCDYKAARKGDLKRHKETKHEGVAYPCDVAGCHYRYSDKSSLIKHKKAKHEGVTCPCDVDGCDYKASFKHHLKRHKESAHEGVIYPCDVDGCDYKAIRKDYLKAHKEAKH